MDDNRLEFIQQPWGFRRDKTQPDWLHFPRLRLLLGWGPGIREYFRKSSLSGLRTIVIPESADISRPPLVWLMTWYDEHFLFNTRLRENAPPLAVFSAGKQNQCFRLGDEGLHKTELDSTIKGLFPVSTSPEFGVRHAVDDDGSRLVLVQRSKRLKAKYQERMKQFGLVYAPGTGKRDNSPDDQRTPSEQHFVEFISAIKHEYIEKRARELEKHPGLRPPNYEERRKAHIRSRLGEMQRGKCDREGRSKRPYTEEALTKRVCGEIARLESTNEMYDFTWIDVYAFHPPHVSAV